MANYYTVGKLVNTQGIRGEVRVVSETDFPEERYRKGQVLYLFHPTLKEPLPLTIEDARQHKNFYILSFKGYHNINDVEKFKGGILKISEADRGTLEEGEFYFHDILGCEIVTEEGELLGTVKEILQPGANDVWVVKRGKESDVLIPYIEDVVKQIDISNKRIVIHLLPGLL
ncbi:ribosome maturation factor RimM [Aneurinibacillus sp. Ricciae_BoGa-3]|uniref:ribosome maturation factor RimM n=1 Tax=Aneurinibacillus sp. Ricciae_BoGa-3 TaxID=3022697 RepID=UPI002340EED3|nr:ribosome maturation factor RimM [Aneurinibacillus sp. Ricciae_BoGa-3]WCK56836.1 ribosome maturation factor RimM [Aneurinibacillus sp. Ricciae_BoGa-3]